jgi:hypothetical protein
MSQSSTQEALADIFLNPVMPVMMIGMGYMLFLVARAATARRIVSVPDGEVIPLKATFAGMRGLPSNVALATNNASPLLIIRSTGIEYRVMRLTKRSFEDIDMVDVRTAWRTVNIEMQFRDQLLTFAGNVGTEEVAQRALSLFPAKTPMTTKAYAMRLAGLGR